MIKRWGCLIGVDRIPPHWPTFRAFPCGPVNSEAGPFGRGRRGPLPCAAENLAESPAEKWLLLFRGEIFHDTRRGRIHFPTAGDIAVWFRVVFRAGRSVADNFSQGITVRAPWSHGRKFPSGRRRVLRGGPRERPGKCHYSIVLCGKDWQNVDEFMWDGRKNGTFQRFLREKNFGILKSLFNEYFKAKQRKKQWEASTVWQKPPYE